jgi:hypothetical protein
MVKMCNTNDGSWVLDVSVHLLSRALVSQSALVTCCTLTWFMLHVSIVFMVYWVNFVFTWSKLLVFSIRYAIGVIKHGRRKSQAPGSTQVPEGWCTKHSITSSAKQMPACQSTTLPKCKTSVRLCVCIYIYIQCYLSKKNKLQNAQSDPKFDRGGFPFRNCTKSNELLAITHWNLNGCYASLLERRAVG